MYESETWPGWVCTQCHNSIQTVQDPVFYKHSVTCIVATACADEHCTDEEYYQLVTQHIAKLDEDSLAVQACGTRTHARRDY